MAAGSISEDEFRKSVDIFLSLSQKYNDGWHMKKEENGNCYIWKKEKKKECKGHQQTCNSETEDAEELFANDQIQEEDVACLMLTRNEGQILTCEYQVLYSHSYNVPVLYFNIHKQNGKLMSLEEIWEMVPDVYRERLHEERWTFITQQEHPICGRPFFYLHPCHTADLMKNIPYPNQKRNYILTWLSAVAPVIALKIPLDYGKELEKCSMP